MFRYIVHVHEQLKKDYDFIHTGQIWLSITNLN